VSDAKLPSRNGGDLGENKCAMISRRNFLSLLAPLPLLPVVGPPMLLSEKPTQLGWTPARTYQVPPDVERWCSSNGASFSWRHIAERLLLERDLEREILRRQRLSARI
jgi:hypothetical protein